MTPFHSLVVIAFVVGVLYAINELLAPLSEGIARRVNRRFYTRGGRRS